MKSKYLSAVTSLAKIIPLSLLSFCVFGADNGSEIEQVMEVMTITNRGVGQPTIDESYGQGQTTTSDLASWLNAIPGANVNRNGPVTGIAQFRGLYGDRVATTIDGHMIIGAGPNAMDTPLSYSTPLIVESITAFRGIAPVSSAMNTLGGAIDVKMRKADVEHQDSFTIKGDLQAGYRTGTDATTFAGVVNASKDDVAVMLYGAVQQGDDYEAGDGRIVTPTEFSKSQWGTDLRYRSDRLETGLAYHYTDTNDSGTPALPMDIEFIYSNRLSFDGNYQAKTWLFNWNIGYLDAEHSMTNFDMRANQELSSFRRNIATSDTLDYKFTMENEFTSGELLLGIDGYQADHDSVITNPNNAMFFVNNFSRVVDDRIGIFAQWQQSINNIHVHVGARLKHAKSDAGAIGSSMAMMSNNMGTMGSLLRDRFNQADRSIDDTNFDVALNMQTALTKNITAYLGLGIKNRAPSYQERYLWMPMEATGGLADGNTYIGDINLASETAYQSDFGLTYQAGKVNVSAHLYYQNIDDYIQGTALGMEDMTASMVAMMMAGDDNPLKFTNVDAKLYGADLNWSYRFSDKLRLESIVSYVEGERRDIDDHLYRVAPLNGQVNLVFTEGNYIAQLNVTAVDAQNNVSMTNDEQTSAGYGLVNIEGQYIISNDLSIKGGIDNLLDKNYIHHLAGYNRVKDGAIDVMERLPAEGLSAWIEIAYQFK